MFNESYEIWCNNFPVFKEGLWDLIISLRQYLQMSSRMHDRRREIVLRILQRNTFWNLSCYKCKVSLGGNRKHEIVSAYKLWLQTLKLRGMAVHLFWKVVPLKYLILINGLVLCFTAGNYSFFWVCSGKTSNWEQWRSNLPLHWLLHSVEETLWELAFICSSWFFCVLSLFHLAFVLAGSGIKFGSYRVS